MKLFCDTANFADIKEAAKNPNISGFTTNPSLMKIAGITDYKDYAIRVIEYLKDNRPDTCLSLEAFADNPDELYRQACTINDWANTFKYPVYVKIPVMNSKGIYNTEVINSLSYDNVKVNVTAIMTPGQVDIFYPYLNQEVDSIISIFAGRIGDAGQDPTEIIKRIYCALPNGKTQILWASTREIYNYHDAFDSYCDIITMSPEQIKKMELLKDKNLNDYSIETCKMFYDDAIKCGYTI
jgi:transaldolase